MANVKLSDDAINDLKSIKDYVSVELCNEEAAKNTVSKITKKLRMLENYPNAGASLSAIMNVNTDYRFLVCGNYTAFYRIDDDLVYVVRVLYGRRDFIRILFGYNQKEDE